MRWRASNDATLTWSYNIYSFLSWYIAWMNDVDTESVSPFLAWHMIFSFSWSRLFHALSTSSNFIGSGFPSLRLTNLTLKQNRNRNQKWGGPGEGGGLVLSLSLKEDLTWKRLKLISGAIWSNSCMPDKPEANPSTKKERENEISEIFFFVCLRVGRPGLHSPRVVHVH